MISHPTHYISNHLFNLGTYHGVLGFWGFGVLGNSNLKIDTLENKAFLLEMNGKDEQAERIRRKYLKNYNDI